MGKIKIDLGKYDVVFEGYIDDDVEISVFEKETYYKRSLSKDEVNSLIIMLKKSVNQ